MFPDKDHPRNHALTIAAANQLHRGGHISAAKRAQIAAKAKAKINQMKGAGHYMSTMQPKEPPAFGSLAPDEAGDA